MIVSNLRVKNWKNFLDAEFPLQEHTYLIGPNASGKSNALDVFRFLRDIAISNGGGLQRALHNRGGVKKIRCLHARRTPNIMIDVELKDSIDSDKQSWRYLLEFTQESSGKRRSLVTQEKVWRDGVIILNRPSPDDQKDKELLTQTALEQIRANAAFRDLVGFFSSIVYMHLVPQLLKFSDKFQGNMLENDPFGQGFLDRIRNTSKSIRDKRFERIEKALSHAVPNFEDLNFETDDKTGSPHIEARYTHYRPNAGRQREDEFSDGTLRLIALLWMLQEKTALLLLEEPELSLNDEIVRQIPLMFNSIQGVSKSHASQIIVSTHSRALLDNPGIRPEDVLKLQLTKQGTTVYLPDDRQRHLFDDGFSAGDVMLPETAPKGVEKMSSWVSR